MSHGRHPPGLPPRQHRRLCPLKRLRRVGGARGTGGSARACVSTTRARTSTGPYRAGCRRMPTFRRSGTCNTTTATRRTSMVQQRPARARQGRVSGARGRAGRVGGRGALARAHLRVWLLARAALPCRDAPTKSACVSCARRRPDARGDPGFQRSRTPAAGRSGAGAGAGGRGGAASCWGHRAHDDTDAGGDGATGRRSRGGRKDGLPRRGDRGVVTDPKERRSGRRGGRLRESGSSMWSWWSRSGRAPCGWSARWVRVSGAQAEASQYGREEEARTEFGGSCDVR